MGKSEEMPNLYQDLGRKISNSCIKERATKADFVQKKEKKLKTLYCKMAEQCQTKCL